MLSVLDGPCIADLAVGGCEKFEPDDSRDSGGEGPIFNSDSTSFDACDFGPLLEVASDNGRVVGEGE